MNPTTVDQSLGDVEAIEIAMLELLLTACGVYEGDLSPAGRVAVLAIGGVCLDAFTRTQRMREAARWLRERSVGLGTPAERYSTMGWMSIGL